MPNYSNDGQNISTNTMRASAMPAGQAGFAPTNSSEGLLQTSTNIFIHANGAVVGMLQSFRVSENRGVTKLNAIGFEGVVQAVPQNTNGGQLDVTRMALYSSNLWRALGLTSDGSPHNGIASKVHTTGFSDTTVASNTPYDQLTAKSFRTLRDQRVPLEIVVKTPMDGNHTSFMEERYVDCWLASYSKSFAVGEITVSENATIQYGDVY